MSVGLEYRGFDELDKAFNKLLDSREGLRRKYHEQLADIAKEEVDRGINATVNDRNGKVRGWQEKSVGSGGGYAAVRAQKGKTGKDSPGAITNYLESGHKIRSPSGKAKQKRRRRVNVAYVNGRHFYRSAQSSLDSKLLSIAREYADEIGSILNGG